MPPVLWLSFSELEVLGGLKDDHDTAKSDLVDAKELMGACGKCLAALGALLQATVGMHATSLPPTSSLASTWARTPRTSPQKAVLEWRGGGGSLYIRRGCPGQLIPSHAASAAANACGLLGLGN